MSIDFTKRYVMQNWKLGDFLEEVQIDNISESCSRLEEFASTLFKTTTINSTAFKLDSATGLYKATLTHSLNRKVQVINCINTLKEDVIFATKSNDLNNIDIYLTEGETVDIVIV